MTILMAALSTTTCGSIGHSLRANKNNGSDPDDHRKIRRSAFWLTLVETNSKYFLLLFYLLSAPSRGFVPTSPRTVFGLGRAVLPFGCLLTTSKNDQNDNRQDQTSDFADQGSTNSDPHPTLRRILNTDSICEIFQTPTSDQVQQSLDKGSFWNATGLNEIGGWDGFVAKIQQSLAEVGERDKDHNFEQVDNGSEDDDDENANGIGGVLQEATDRIESFLDQAPLTSTTLDELISKSRHLLETRRRPEISGPNPELLSLVENATSLTASEILDDTLEYASTMVEVAEIVLRNGFIAATTSENGDDGSDDQTEFWDVLPAKNTTEAYLLENFTSAYAVAAPDDFVLAAEMGALCVSIYRETVPRIRALGHTLVDRGLTTNVAWMVTDSVVNTTNGSSSGNRLRTVTIRGFDPSDEDCDAEELLQLICSASPEEFVTPSGELVLLHSGLLQVARAIHEQIRPHIVFNDGDGEESAPFDQLVLAGHSIGGSNALLILFLLVEEFGIDFIRDKIMKVFTFGSPPVVALPEASSKKEPAHKDFCAILEAFGLPSTLIHSYVQPWDPINRLFTEIDALYPLAGDLGADGKTIFADGPPGRALRPILKSLLDSWQGWPRFRETFQDKASQNYTSIGLQHLLLPSPRRYLADRFVSATIPVPPIDCVVRLSPAELHPVLTAAFPLDVFEISFVPQAVRSLVHHFSPSYGLTLVHFLGELEKESRGEAKRDSEYSFTEEEIDGMMLVVAN